jgi:acyl-CoA thioesterase I
MTMISRIFLSLILLLGLTTTAQDQTPTQIICLGDSLTAGYGVNETQAWPHLLQLKLTEAKINAKIINAGTSGNTSAGGLRKLPWLFKKSVDVLILALGANDGLRGIDTKSTHSNLKKIILAAQKKQPNIKIILAGMKVPPNMGQKFSSDFEAIFTQLTKEHNCTLIPFLLENVAGEQKLNLSDGIHPNPAGHKIISENVWKHLKELI